MRYLIVNADDFGFSPEINRGVCEAFVNGIVTDCSLLVHSPYAQEAIEMAQEIGLPVGIHLDMVSEFARNSSPYFGPDGNLVQLLFKREFERRYEAVLSCDLLICIRNEMRMQIGKFISMAGRLPSHLDYHYGLHYLPEVMAIYISVAEEYGLPVRWGSQYAGKNPYWLAPDCFCDRFRGLKEGSIELLLDLLQTPWDHIMELVCHPGYFTLGHLPDNYNQERELELKALTSQRVKQVINDLGIQLINYNWLKEVMPEIKLRWQRKDVHDGISRK